MWLQIVSDCCILPPVGASGTVLPFFSQSSEGLEIIYHTKILMNTHLPSSLPWKPEKELWPIPDWIPAEAAAKFPGIIAVELLVKDTAVNFFTIELARESAIGFVNYRRREMSKQEDFGVEV